MRAVFVLTLLLVPLAGAAGGDALAQIEVASALLEGDVRAGGDLRAYVDAPEAGKVPHTVPLRILAESLEVAVRAVNTTIVLGEFRVTDHPAVDDHEPRTTRHGPATVHSGAVRAGYGLGVFPMGGGATATATGTCGAAALPGLDTAGVQDMVNGTHRYHVPVGGALRWSPCPGTVTVTGDFRVVLWEVDVRVQDGEGPHDYPSGYRRHDGLGPQDEVQRGVNRQVVLTATNATLELLPMRGGTALYLDAPWMRLDGRAVFGAARGRVVDGGGWRSVDGETLSLRGSLAGEASPAEATGRWGVNLTGSLAAAPEGALAPAEGLGGWAVPAAVLSTLAALGALWAAAGWRRGGGPASLARRLRRRASRLVEAGRPRRAGWSAAAAVLLDPAHGDGHALRALALASRGRLTAALGSHLRAHHRLPVRPRALNAFEAARVCGLLGRGQEAAHWLSIAAHIEPGLLDAASREPDFAPVAADGSFRSILRGLLPDAATP